MIRHRFLAAAGALAIAMAAILAAPDEASAQAPAAAAAVAGSSAWTPPRTPWGDPDIQGSYTNKDENGTPFERPDDLPADLAELSDEEFAAIIRERQERARERAPLIGGDETGAGPTHWYEHLGVANSQPWFVVDPKDGKIPALTAAGEARARNQAPRQRHTPDSFDDFSLYDRCITRGLPGSMMPAIYGNSYDIVQAPGYVAIRYEMIHETRVIPLNGVAKPSPQLPQYMGVPRGRWEGNTLVVETTHFRPETAYRNANPKTLRLIERFTPTGPDRLQWSVTVVDPETWQEPWTFSMPLKKDDTHDVFEYACHEGNRGLENILRAMATGQRSSEPEQP